MPVFETVLLDTPTLTVRHNAQLQLLHVIWRGPYDAEAARAGGELMLPFISHTHCTLMLNDSSEVFGDWWKAGEWLGQVFVAELIKRGIKVAAWINSMDWPSRHSVASTLPHMQGIEIRIFDFDEQEEAYAWLLSKAPPAPLTP